MRWNLNVAHTIAPYRQFYRILGMDEISPCWFLTSVMRVIDQYNLDAAVLVNKSD